MSDATLRALGKLSEALETTERARGALYDFHQLTGHADLMLDEVVTALRVAGHPGWADQVQAELVGRNVIEGRWTFQIIEDYEDHYMAHFRQLEAQLRDALAEGRRHLHEAALKQSRQQRQAPRGQASEERRPPTGSTAS